MKGYVSNIQKFSVHDGPGIRTIVFLLGCTLRCKWCQNPETYEREPRLMHQGELCKGCVICRELGCPYEAKKMSGKEFSEDEVFNEVAKDKVFYENSGGGVTISGGEPLLQIDFTHGLLKKLKENGMNTAIETAGNISFENFERIIPLVDSWLFDIKFFDRKKHEHWTGSSNELTLSNLERLISKTEAEIIIRVPLIPCINDGEEFEKIVNHVIKFPKIKELHILPFHQIGSSKFADLGVEYEMENYREENDGNIERAKKYAEGKGLKVSVGGAGF